MMKNHIGFIGLGNMGMGMAKNILQTGFPLVAYDIQEEPLKKIKALGAQLGENPKEVAQKASVSIIAVLNYAQVEQVVLGERGLCEGVSSGDLVIIASTIAPAEVKALARTLEKQGVKVLDAPISGGKEGAEAGTLTIMVGGEKAEFERCRNIFEAMGKNIYYLGALGSGLSLKLVNNLLVAVNGLAVAEGMVLGVKAGLDPQMMLDIIPKSAGDSWMFRNRAYRMVDRDFTCRGELDILLKDLTFIMDMGRSLKIPLVLSAVAKEIFQMANCLGYGKEDDAAIVKVIEKIAGMEVKKAMGDR
ncbi:MAG: NAD(P)-dependent oxidoreductase [Deltaproteobacteria bacterium]|nr:NAD(P)-dependent oxidoreductase [Deltaproteobacteria bacterium]